MAETDYKQTKNQLLNEAATADSCPLATQDLGENTRNRQRCIDEAAYGPANPALDDSGQNDEFWQKYADKWNDTVENVKTMRCGGCTYFDRSPEMLQCIEMGIGAEGDPETAVEGGELGYCKGWDFKCASMRVCFTWAGSVQTTA